MLNWFAEPDAGRWSARSSLRVVGVTFDFVIVVCDDGSFDVSESDAELIGARPVSTFETLEEAKAFCQQLDTSRGFE